MRWRTPLQQSLNKGEGSPKIFGTPKPGSPVGGPPGRDRQKASPERPPLFPWRPRRQGGAAFPPPRRTRWKAGEPRILGSGEAPPRRGRAAVRAKGPYIRPSSMSGPGRIAFGKPTPVAPLPHGGVGGGADGPVHKLGGPLRGRGRTADCMVGPDTSPSTGTGPVPGVISAPTPIVLRGERRRGERRARVSTPAGPIEERRAVGPGQGLETGPAGEA